MARKAVPHDRYRLVGTYERLRKNLLEQPRGDRLDRELSYWVLPTDRRLPIAFLDMPLRELLSHTLDELMETPGVGQKKILGFFDLLRRIAKTGLEDEPFGLTKEESAQVAEPAGLGFDATVVSEAIWSTWCDTIRRNGLADQKLGRLAPSLQALPTVIWHTPLSAYSDLTLTSMRRLRTHGEKRVHAILEVFCTVHEAISTAALHENLDLELTPRFVPRLTRWLTEIVWEETLPPAEEIYAQIVQPMIHQIEIDLGYQVAGLAADRLRLDDDAPSVKQQAESLGVTRARVYQLLDDCAKAMDVRWPEGRWLLAPLTNKFGGASPNAIGLLHGVRELFYPEERPIFLESPKRAIRARGS